MSSFAASPGSVCLDRYSMPIVKQTSHADAASLLQRVCSGPFPFPVSVPLCNSGFCHRSVFCSAFSFPSFAFLLLVRFFAFLGGTRFPSHQPRMHPGGGAASPRINRGCTPMGRTVNSYLSRLYVDFLRASAPSVGCRNLHG